MPRRLTTAWDEDDFMGGSNRQGERGLEPDFGGLGTSVHYRGGSWVDQRDTTRSHGPYVGRGPKGYTRSDENVYEDVCERLTRFGHVDASEIEVQVSRGEVTLSGSVEDRDQKRLAEDLADSVSGVVDVHNRLVILRPAPETARPAPAEEEEDVGVESAFPGGR